MNKLPGEIILEVKELQTHLRTEDGLVKAVDGVSFSIRKGETLGLVGESGCGKSMTALSIMQLVPSPQGKIVGGEIQYASKVDNKVIRIDQIRQNDPRMRKIRGNEIAMIFQEPMTSFSPVFRIGHQIIEAIRLHQRIDQKEARKKAIKMLDIVGIPAASKRIDDFPHQFSGGMLQRAMIAMALSCDPNLLIADEPTTALDVTIEAQILELLSELQKEFGLSILIITHDLGVVAEMADEIAVMYAGKIVELAGVSDLFHNHRHPYTDGLLKSIPKIGRYDPLVPIPGSVPSLFSLGVGCSFASRCGKSFEKCHQAVPPLSRTGQNHETRCWLYPVEGGGAS